MSGGNGGRHALQRRARCSHVVEADEKGRGSGQGAVHARAPLKETTATTAASSSASGCPRPEIQRCMVAGGLCVAGPGDAAAKQLERLTQTFGEGLWLRAGLKPRWKECGRQRVAEQWEFQKGHRRHLKSPQEKMLEPPAKASHHPQARPAGRAEADREEPGGARGPCHTNGHPFGGSPAFSRVLDDLIYTQVSGLASTSSAEDPWRAAERARSRPRPDYAPPPQLHAETCLVTPGPRSAVHTRKGR